MSLEGVPVLPEGMATAQSQRWETLLGLLADRDRLSVSDAARELGVSESTIRRDFDLMEQAQLARRTHGGIIASTIAYGLPIKHNHVSSEIRRIGEAAATLVLERFGPKPTIGVNGGATTTSVVDFLGRATELPPRKGAGLDEPSLTVVSDALNIAMALVLRPQVRIVSLGGVVRSQSFELTGPMATDMLRSLWIECMVLGFEGIDPSFGPTCRDVEEAAVTGTMIQRAESLIAVGASNKIGVRSSARICGIRRVDTLVTDKGITSEQLAALEAAKVEVVAV